jgi:hypothetical protein
VSDHCAGCNCPACEDCFPQPETLNLDNARKALLQSLENDDVAKQPDNFHAALNEFVNAKIAIEILRLDEPYQKKPFRMR